MGRLEVRWCIVGGASVSAGTSQTYQKDLQSGGLGLHESGDLAVATLAAWWKEVDGLFAKMEYSSMFPNPPEARDCKAPSQRRARIISIAYPNATGAEADYVVFSANPQGELCSRQETAESDAQCVAIGEEALFRREEESAPLTVSRSEGVLLVTSGRKPLPRKRHTRNELKSRISETSTVVD